MSIKRRYVDPVADFWNKQSATFTAADGLRRSYHLEFAEILNRTLTGKVLCVGGLYQNVDLDDRQRSLLVVDVSEQMLRASASRGASVQRGDARSLPFAKDSVDHVIFPLVLHHVTDGQGESARENVGRCLREAQRVLRPGGAVWAIEILVSDAVYSAELALAPFTRAFLAKCDIPLVIFHSSKFYVSQLAGVGFSDVSFTPSTDSSSHWYDLVRPVIGLSLKVPRIMVPVTYALLRGVKPLREGTDARRDF